MVAFKIKKKEIIVFWMILLISTGVKAVNVSFDAGEYQFRVEDANGDLVGLYVNSSANLGLNDYVLILEERPMNMTYMDILYYPLNFIEDNIIPATVFIAVLFICGLFILFYKLATS